MVSLKYYLAHANCTLFCASNAQKKDRFTTAQKNYFFGCLMNVFLGVVK